MQKLDSILEIASTSKATTSEASNLTKVTFIILSCECSKAVSLKSFCRRCRFFLISLINIKLFWIVNWIVCFYPNFPNKQKTYFCPKCRYDFDLKLKTFDVNTKYFSYLGIFRQSFVFHQREWDYLRSWPVVHLIWQVYSQVKCTKGYDLR